MVGPLSSAASIPATSGQIAPAGSAQIPVTMDSSVSLLPGNNYPLQILAASKANPLVQTVISSVVTVNKSKGVTSAISPSQASVTTTPGPVSLLFRVNNTGNTDDTYTASITQSGGLTATLGGPRKPT